MSDSDHLVVVMNINHEFMDSIESTNVMLQWKLAFNLVDKNKCGMPPPHSPPHIPRPPRSCSSWNTKNTRLFT